MTYHYIECDELTHKGINIGLCFRVEVNWHYAEKDWTIDRIHCAKEGVISDNEEDWVRVDDEADFQWIIPAINEHVRDDLQLADMANAIEWDRKERAA